MHPRERSQNQLSWGHTPKKMKPMKETIEEIQEKVNGLCQQARASKLGRWEALAIVGEYCQLLESVWSLGNFFQEWLDSAQAGETLRQKHQEVMSKIQTQKAALQHLHQEHTKLAEKEREWQQLSEASQRLQSELERLKQLQELVKTVNLEELRRQVDQLKEGKDLLEADDLETQILSNATAIVVLAESAIEKFNAETREMLLRAEETEKMTRQKAEELSQARERYRKAQEEWEKLRGELDPLLEADKRVAEALPQEGVRNVLEGIEKVTKLIQSVEEALKEGIKANERENRRRYIYLGGA
jgi:DNA repair exonuclease SbcCD ATPase subunit